MKRKLNPFFLIYEFLIVLPVWAVITIVAALITIVITPISPNSNFSYFPARFWARSICYMCFVRVKIVGMDKLDRSQSYVFMMNHQSWFDIFTVYGWLPFFFKWIMKANLRKIPFVGAACEAAGHIFLERRTPIAAKRGLEKAKSVLKDGISVVIFPEGTRTYTGEMGKFKKGGFKIAMDLGLSIVPVTLRGCFERMPRNTLAISSGPIEVYVHNPIDVTSYSSEEIDKLMEETWIAIDNGL